jgi:hypothetical protein
MLQKTPFSNYNRKVKFEEPKQENEKHFAWTAKDNTAEQDYKSTGVYKVICPLLTILKCFLVYSLDKREIRNMKLEIIKRIVMFTLAIVGLIICINIASACDFSQGLKPIPTMRLGNMVWCIQVLGTILAANWALYQGQLFKKC